MTKTIEYRAIPHDRWMLVRFEGVSEGGTGSVGSTQCGEFPNEEAANKYGEMIAKSEEGAVFVSRGSMNRAPTKGAIGSGGLSSS